MTTAQPLWRMSLSGSELAGITREGDELVLAFAVAQVRPAAPRLGQGDETAYLAGVVWRLTGAVAMDEATAQALQPMLAHGGHAFGRVTHGALDVAGPEVLLPSAFDSTSPTGITLRLACAHGGELTLRATGVRCEWASGQAGDATVWPSLAC